MKRLITVLLLSLVLWIPTAPEAQDLAPDQTTLLSRFTSILTIDSFVIASGPSALAVNRWDPDTRMLRPIRQYLLPGAAVAMKRDGDILTVQTADHNLIFVDLSELPETEILGTFDPGFTFSDFAQSNGDIFLSRWFDGVGWYSTSDRYQTFNVIDSSMRAVNTTQLHVSGGNLFALDEYNGLLKYHLTGGDLHGAQEYLLVPERPVRFAMGDGSVYLSLNSNERRLAIGEFGHGGSGVIDSILGIQPAEHLILHATGIVVISAESVEAIDFAKSGSLLSASTRGKHTRGDLLEYDGERLLFLADRDRGIAMMSLDAPIEWRQVWDRPGPIADLAVLHGKMATAGGSNPMDVFAVPSPVPLNPSYSFDTDIDTVRGLTRNGDSLFVLHGADNRMSILTGWDRAEHQDSVAIETSDPLGVDGDVDLWFVPRPGLDEDLMLLQQLDAIRVYRLQDDVRLEYDGTWNTAGMITSIDSRDSLLYVATLNRRLVVYRIGDSPPIDFRALLDLPFLPRAVVARRDGVWVMGGRSFASVDCSNPFAPRIESQTLLGQPVLDATVDNNRLLTVGEAGMAAYRLLWNTPELISSGGPAGIMIAAHDGVFATSDGSSVSVYHRPEFASEDPDAERLPTRYRLDQNYPNPFNASTVIGFRLSDRARVNLTIYNALGQQVRVLADDVRSAGEHQVRWVGDNSAGEAVASGIYFYKLQVDSDSETSRKMLLVK